MPKKLLSPSKAYLIKVGEEPREIQPENGTDFSLQELYRLLDCDMVEIARTQMTHAPGRAWRNNILIIDEEGKCKGKPANDYASEWYSHPCDIIVGDAILCPTGMFK
jgi:hypothetical protein